MSSSVRWVAWTSDVVGRSRPWSASSRVGRDAVRLEAGVVLGDLLGEVDVEGAVADPRGDRVEVGRGDGAHGVDGGADPRCVAARTDEPPRPSTRSSHASTEPSL